MKKNIFTGTFVQISSLDIPELFTLFQGREKKGAISFFYNASVILTTSILDNKKDFCDWREKKMRGREGGIGDFTRTLQNGSKVPVN